MINRNNVDISGGNRIVLLVVIAAFTVSPASAASKHKKSKQNTEAEEIAKQNDNTRRLLRDALPLGGLDLLVEY